jgi:hypothetical protein
MFEVCPLATDKRHGNSIAWFSAAVKRNVAITFVAVTYWPDRSLALPPVYPVAACYDAFS